MKIDLVIRVDGESFAEIEIDKKLFNIKYQGQNTDFHYEKNHEVFRAIRLFVKDIEANYKDRMEKI